MGSYRAIWNVQADNGLIGPGGIAELNELDAGVLAALGAIEPDPIAPPQPATAEERNAAMLAFVPSLTIGDFTQAGTLRAEARRRATAALGFEPSDDELRAATEAYAKAPIEQPPA